LVLLAELIILGSAWAISPAASGAHAHPTPEGVTNTEALGRILYTNYVHVFQGAGMVLLVAMIGAIVLTLRHREGVKRQNVRTQVGRRRAEAVELRKVRPGEGL
jgi:NADH-quinone oxidoreductase subunit J